MRFKEAVFVYTRLGTDHQFLSGTFGFSLKIPPFLRKLITFVKQNTHNLAGIPAKAGSFSTLHEAAKIFRRGE